MDAPAPPVPADPPKQSGANSPFHRGMRQIFILHALSGSSIYLIGVFGLALWILCVAYTLLLTLVMIWQLARSRPPEMGALAATASTLLVSAIAIFTDANIFTPHDPRPGVYPRQTFIWLSLAMFSLLSLVWAVRILMDFNAKLAKFRAALAITCAIFFYLLSNLESLISAGARNYNITSFFYHQTGGRTGYDINLISYRLQTLRQNSELLIILLLLSGGTLGIASCFDRPKPTPALPLTPPDTYEI